MNNELSAILGGLASNPEFIKIVAEKCKDSKKPFIMGDIVDALSVIKKEWEIKHSPR